MAGVSTFDNVSDKVSFSAEEEKILAYWREIDAFQESLRQSAGRKPYVFYDGPPFATGLPHYGHILAGTIKDVVTRYAHQRGFYVERRFGWDCHGLPVEHEIDKAYNIKGRDDVMKMGIDKYNEECRSIVQRYVKEWREVVERFGRWVDFDNDYKTMQPSFMETGWWVFKQLFDKGMVYRAFRVMPYSTVLSTPMANFEVALNYKEVSDPSIIVQFKHAKEKDCWILAWTTTPWTLPSNIALCVNPKLTYLRVKNKKDGQVWIVGKDRWSWVCSSIKKDPAKDFTVEKEVLGETLVGTPYLPLFDYFKSKVIKEKAWHIVSDGYVSTEAGTCIVHQAPAFGEDDNRVCLKHGVILKDGTGLVCPVDNSGCFTDEVPEFKGQHVKEADKGLKELLKKNGNLVFNGTEVHNYPHCWRSDTPLIYKAVPSWFVKVEEIRDKLIANNNKTYWVPSSIKEKRFHNWLSEARDWCVSRNRYWGLPIPLWVSDDFEEVVCIGSIAELEEHAGRKITDIHRHFIDDIKIKSKKGKGMLKRVDEVFDCWFESGSMPYGSRHYPFEDKEGFEKNFPADFCAEGLDQTRGWFYTLMVLSTHLFDQPAFKNLIVNGLVLAADGKKMSKRLKNYPDPMSVCKNHGADAVRMYMCNSPVVRAEPLKFQEAGVRDVAKDVFLPFYHAYRFFVQQATLYEKKCEKFVPDAAKLKASTNYMDKWINASNNELIKFVRAELEAYRLYTVVPRLVAFLEDLTNWYVRLNRERMRGVNGADEAHTSLSTLYTVLLNVTVLLAPITPFITEMIFGNLAKALPEGHPMKARSVHFVMIPEPDMAALNPEIMTAVSRMQSIVMLSRTCRMRRNVGLKKPIKSVTLINKNPDFVKDLKTLESYLLEEINVVEVVHSTDTSKAKVSAVPNFKILGKKLGGDMKAVKAAIEKLSHEQVLEFEEKGEITICGHVINAEEMQITRQIINLGEHEEANSNADSSVILDLTPDPELDKIAIARDVQNRVQKLRKAADLQPGDPVDMWAKALPSLKTKESSGTLQNVLNEKAEFLNKQLRNNLFPVDKQQGHEVLIQKEVFDDIDEVGGDRLEVHITVRAAYFNDAEIKKLTKGDAAAEGCIRQYLQTFGIVELAKVCTKGDLTVTLGGKTLKLKHNVHYSVGPSEASWLAK